MRLHNYQIGDTISFNILDRAADYDKFTIFAINKITENHLIFYTSVNNNINAKLDIYIIDGAVTSDLLILCWDVYRGERTQRKLCRSDGLLVAYINILYTLEVKVATP